MPTTSQSWLDEALQSHCDISQISWVATGNDVGPLRGPLLNRFRVISVPCPKSEHFDVVFNTILSDIALELGLETNDLPDLAGQVIDRLQAGFRSGRSLRRIKSAVESCLIVSGVPIKPRQVH